MCNVPQWMHDTCSQALDAEEAPALCLPKIANVGRD